VQQETHILYPAATNGKGGDRCCPHKGFNGDESKYKLWIRMVGAFIRPNPQLFSTPKLGINFALSYMNEGKAADWAEHFTDKYTVNNVFCPNLSWEAFKKLLEKMSDVRKMKDKVQVNLSVLKHKPGDLERHIFDFNALSNQAGYALAEDQENALLTIAFLKEISYFAKD
jgi:hypothetical protein